MRATAIGIIASQVRIGDFRAGTTVLVALATGGLGAVFSWVAI
jgi:hypothetical protein